jgi:hypothetical protein
VRVNLPSDVDVQAGSMDLPCGDEEPLDCASNVSSDVGGVLVLIAGGGGGLG